MLEYKMTMNSKEEISLIIKSIIDMIKNPNIQVSNSAYFYNSNEKQNFIIYLYLFKLIINDNDYLDLKYRRYLEKFNTSACYSLSSVTNIECKNELDLLYKIKEKLSNFDYYFKDKEERIYFSEKTYVDSKWLLTFISLLLDNGKNEKTKEINICYTIPKRDITKLTEEKDKEKFLASFVYYHIKVTKTDEEKEVRENNILIVKNAAINYLKHLKQFKHGLESEDSYLIFYNLLKKECQKEGFELEENECSLLDVDPKFLDKISFYIDEEFYEQQLSKQVHIIENAVWQLSNDITLLEHMNNSIDSLIDMLTIIKVESKETYSDIKRQHNINDIKILLILICNQFLLTYLTDKDELDYSLLDLTAIKPKYMNSICDDEEQEIKTRIKSLNYELSTAKKNLEKFKEERSTLDKDILGQDKYQKELERCVSNINRESIVIARLNSTISSLKREYEELKKDQIKKYRNVDLYNYNHSIIKHICNSILGCSFYMKSNNQQALFSNIIIFEDYEKTDNSFYLEVTFKDLLKISNKFVINGIKEQFDLPKLA